MMRAERVVTEPIKPGMGSGRLIAAALGCFAVGFGSLVAVPRFWPRYVQVAPAVDAVPDKPLEVGTALPPPPPAPGVAVPGVILPIKRTGAFSPQKIEKYAAPAE